MAITSSAVIPSNSLEEFRIEFNKLVTDVDGISAASAFGASISFEGATSDDFETTLIVTDPTADRTITLPNVTGTVLTTGNSDVATTTTSSGDADFVLVDDGGVLKKISKSNLGVGTPTDITIADESSDTTCFPLFVTAATGDLGPKSGTNLTFNSSTGLLFATGLSIADAGTIGSASDTDAIAISSAGIVSFSAATEATATGTASVTLAGGLGVAKDVWLGNDLTLDSDSAVIEFGDSQEITLTHAADSGLNLKHTATGDGTPIKFTLQTGENALTVGEQLGVIDFQAPGESSGSDAILVAAGIEAVAEEEFSATSNATKLSFKTAATATAAETMSLSSGGNLTVEGTISAGSYNDNIVLNGTNSASANGGDDLVLDSSAADTDVNSRIMYEDATGHNFIHDEREEVVVKDKMLLEGNEGIGRILVESNWGDGTIVFEDVVDDTGKVLSTHGVTFEGQQMKADRFRISGSAAADITALTDAATIAIDFEDAQNFSVTLAGNRTLGLPSNIIAGQTGSIFVTQDGTGSRTLSYDAIWDFAGGTAPTLTTTASAIDRIDYIVVDTSNIQAVATLAFS